MRLSRLDLPFVVEARTRFGRGFENISAEQKLYLMAVFAIYLAQHIDNDDAGGDSLLQTAISHEIDINGSGRQLAAILDASPDAECSDLLDLIMDFIDQLSGLWGFQE